MNHGEGRQMTALFSTQIPISIVVTSIKFHE